MADLHSDMATSLGGPGASRPPITGRLVFGALLVTLGALWTLDNLGFVDAESILDWWPALLFAYGLAKLFGIGMRRTPVSGGIFTLIGGWMLLRSLGLVHWSIFGLWPVFLIAMGGSIVWRSLRGHGERGTPEDGSPFPRPFAIMGAVSVHVDSQELRGAEATAIMAGVELDLRGSKPSVQPLIIDVVAIWGGVELIVPDNWRVECEVVPIMGGAEDQTRRSDQEPVATVVVRGIAIMGGVEIRNELSGRREAKHAGRREGVATSRGVGEAKDQ